MARKIKIKAKEKDGVVTVKSIMNHPMETGQRKDKDGKKIPAHFISEVIVSANDEEVMNATLGPAVSKNPFMSMEYNGAKGDVVKLTWKDNMGESESAETKAK